MGATIRQIGRGSHAGSGSQRRFCYVIRCLRDLPQVRCVVPTCARRQLAVFSVWTLIPEEPAAEVEWTPGAHYPPVQRPQCFSKILKSAVGTFAAGAEHKIDSAQEPVLRAFLGHRGSGGG